MSHTVHYFAAVISPWTYLGHNRFCALASQTNAKVELCIIDLSKIFPVSGGLPLKQRPIQRQTYRLQELARWRDFLNVPMNIEPAFFPADATKASLITLYLRDHVSTQVALAFLSDATQAIWENQLNIAQDSVLTQLLTHQHLDPAILTLAQSAATAQAYEADTQKAIDAGIFGAPSYCIDDQLYWGQDRLDFVARHLNAQPGLSK